MRIAKQFSAVKTNKFNSNGLPKVHVYNRYGELKRMKTIENAINNQNAQTKTMHGNLYKIVNGKKYRKRYRFRLKT